MATYKELKAQAEALMQQAEAARRAEIAAVVAEIQARMKEYGITLAELKDGAKKTKARGVVAAKYRNPTTGESWSGSDVARRSGWRMSWPRGAQGMSFWLGEGRV